MKKKAIALLVLFLISLACSQTPAQTSTMPPSPPTGIGSPTKSAPTQSPSPRPPTLQVASPQPSATTLSFPTPAKLVGPYTPPTDWMRVDFGISLIFLPPEMTVLVSEEDFFMADLPVAPGTEQVRRILTIENETRYPYCGIEFTPEQALEVDDGFSKYTFLRGYSQEVFNGHTIEEVFYVLYDESLCYYIGIELDSAIIDSNGDPASEFDIQEQIDFLESILSTYMERG